MKNGKDLFSPAKLGPYQLRNRLVMAPLTRNRAGPGNVPQPLNAVYYAQRASAGLIITEATQVSPQGVGYPHTPGIHNLEQVRGWRRVTEAVHRRGGRISHPSLQPGGTLPVAPSAIRPEGEAYTYEGKKPFVTPRALETEEIPEVVAQFRSGAQHALEAGFDGVEIHAANGGFDHDRAFKALEAGDADLIALGRLFLANPDLPERLAREAPLNTPDPATFYGGGERGYIDYPTLSALVGHAA